MSDFFVLHDEFKEEIALMKGGILFVQSSYKGISLLREAKIQAKTPWPPEIIALVDSLAIPNRKTENLTYDGVVVLLAAMYETFVRDTIEAVCREIETRIPKFDELNEKIKSANARATGHVLSKQSSKRYSQFNYLDLSKCLGTCFPGSVKYQLNSGPLSIHERNLNSTELVELFKRIGMEDLWGSIGGSAPIQSHFAITDSILAKKNAIATLDEFILLRNRVAHSGGRGSSIGPDALVQWLEFFLAVTESLAVVVSEYCSNLLPVLSSTSGTTSVTTILTAPASLPPSSSSSP